MSQQLGRKQLQETNRIEEAPRGVERNGTEQQHWAGVHLVKHKHGIIQRGTPEPPMTFTENSLSNSLREKGLSRKSGDLEISRRQSTRSRRSERSTLPWAEAASRSSSSSRGCGIWVL